MSWFNFPVSLVNNGAFRGKSDNIIIGSRHRLSGKHLVESVRRGGKQSAVVQFNRSHIDEFRELIGYKGECFIEGLYFRKALLYLFLRFSGYLKPIQQALRAQSRLRRHFHHEVVHGRNVLLHSGLGAAVHRFAHRDGKAACSRFAGRQEVREQKLPNPVVRYDGLPTVDLLVGGLTPPKVLRALTVKIQEVFKTEHKSFLTY